MRLPRAFQFGRRTVRKAVLLNAMLLAAIAAVFFAARPAASYLQQLQGSATAPLRWDFTAFPVQWRLNPDTSSAKISGDRDPADVITASFQTWLNAPNLALNVSRGPDTSLNSPNAVDGVNLICFVCTGDFSKDSQTLAVTLSFTAKNAGEDDLHGGRTKFAGQLKDADILFNPQVSFSTTQAGPPANVSDLQTVATHEIGHFFGMDHSAVVRATMFPFAPPIERTLSYDDVAGLSQIYPKAAPDVATGVIAGTVRLTDGSAVFGAHVFASSTTNADPYGGALRKTPIGTLTMPDGTYRIAGVPPDSYAVAAEPLDQPVTNQDINTFAPNLGQSSVQTNFTTRWH
ncbi:MAG TPA: matrixin family metalloprotease [Terriglobales bacterium]